MLLDPATFRRLCDARDRLADIAIPLPLVAQSAGMSRFHFIRQYEAVFGVTPHQFRIERRIQLAKQLLASREMSVTETCLEVGMSSLGSFSDLFQRHVGVSPSEYQRRARLMIHVPRIAPLESAPPVFPSCFELLAHLPPDAKLW